jgi:hypothetical protein
MCGRWRKTIWVLLTNADLPLPGTHRPFDAGHALHERITFSFAVELDLLLERATLTHPEQRVSMQEMARELQVCMAAPPEARPTASLAELHARVAARTAASRDEVTQRQERQERQDRLERAWQGLAQIVAETAAELLGRPPFMPHCGESSGRCCSRSAISGRLFKSLWRPRSGCSARMSLPILPRSSESTGSSTTGTSTNRT